jgi:parallel beta-helix repeat protein
MIRNEHMGLIMKKVSPLLKLFVSMSVVLLFTVTANSTTLEVGEGKPYTSIQAAINVAVTGDTVLVYDGTYVEKITFMGNAITVKSVNGAASTIIDGNASGSVVSFNSGDSLPYVLDGFTITNGNSGYGGGISAGAYSSPTITNCIITGNTGNYGGGICCGWSSYLTITNCTIMGNTASEGGGIYCEVYASPSITNCTISGNTASNYGGGIYCNTNSSPTVKNSILWDDSVAVGKEIYLSGSTITVTYSNVDQDGYAGTSGNIRQDPLFVDPVNGDFHLQPDSPCVDAGTSDGAPSTDMEGLPRYDDPLVPNTGGGAYPYYDMGVYELQPMVVAPNEGEIIASGSTFTIRWEPSFLAVKFRLHYSDDNGGIWKEITPDFVGGTSFDWHVPTPLENKETCLVKVVEYDEFDMEVNQYQSDQPFTIEVVRVTSPEGSDVLVSGSTHVIEWITNGTENPVASVRLFYSGDAGISWRPIGRTIVGNPGGFSWRVSRVFETKTECKVKVVLRDEAGMILGSDESAGSFTIQPGPNHRRIH